MALSTHAVKSSGQQGTSNTTTSESFGWGIAPELLVSQVRNTAPFLFEPVLSFPLRKAHRYISVVREVDLAACANSEDSANLPLYYELCLAAHYSTVATFVPTDVDNHIRVKLWHKALAAPEAPSLIERMAQVVKASYDWDVSPVSTRWIPSPVTGEPLAGHMGEWFSVAAGCYAACRTHYGDIAAEMAGMILREVNREARIFREFLDRKDGLGCLISSTIIAHNLGDLERVLDLWKVPVVDPLREALGLDRRNLRLAGELNKHMMAVENHRHFALREPRGLRNVRDLLLPTAPFLDHWGGLVARHPALSDEQRAEVVESLIHGWERLRRDAKPGQIAPVGYARALAGFEQSYHGGTKNVARLLPSRVAKTFTSGALRVEISVPRSRFEDQWSSRALKFIQKEGAT